MGECPVFGTGRGGSSSGNMVFDASPPERLVLTFHDFICCHALVFTTHPAVPRIALATGSGAPGRAGWSWTLSG
jgi:hypothetical protein